MSERTAAEEKDALSAALDEFMEDCRAQLFNMVDAGKRGWRGGVYDIVNCLLNDAQEGGG